MGQAAGRDQVADETAKDREELETELIWKGRRMSGERDGWTGGDRQTDMGLDLKTRPTIPWWFRW